jgi:hypothetical protein
VKPAAMVLAAGLLAACTPGGGHAVAASRPAQVASAHATGHRPSGAAGPRPLPGTLYGVTADRISGLSQLVAGARHLPDRPVTRLYFDAAEPPAYYGGAVTALRPVSYLMGELLDSSDEARISLAAYRVRVRAYLAAFGRDIDLWEIGNEVNGDWTGPYATVEAKLTAAYGEVSAQGEPTALTLSYNAGCGDGPAELSPLAFSRRYVPPSVRAGLRYVFLSYYEDDCGGIRPTAAVWTAYFRALHQLYPHARLGFGEIGLDQPVTAATLPVAVAMLRYYYGLPIRLPYYAGGYFWWYYAEDCLPYGRGALWPALRAAFNAETASQRAPERGAHSAAPSHPGG